MSNEFGPRAAGDIFELRSRNQADAIVSMKPWNEKLRALTPSELREFEIKPDGWLQALDAIYGFQDGLPEADKQLMTNVTKNLFRAQPQSYREGEIVVNQHLARFGERNISNRRIHLFSLLLAAFLAFSPFIGKDAQAATPVPTATTTPQPDITPKPIEVPLPTTTPTPTVETNAASSSQAELDSNEKSTSQEIQLRQEYQLLTKLQLGESVLPIGSVIRIEVKVNNSYLIKLIKTDESYFVVVDSQTLENASLKTQEVKPEPETTVTPESTVPLYINVEVEIREATTVLNMRSGPGTTFEVMGSIPSGEIVEIIEDLQNGWAQVEDSDGKVAFVASQFLTNAKIIQKSVLNPEHPDYELYISGSSKEAVGGAISDQELSDAAQTFFSEKVEIDTTSGIPLAKIQDYVVGEYRDGGWQHLDQEVVIDEHTIEWYPDTRLEINKSGQPELIQEIADTQSTLAIWNEEENQWQLPSLNSLELTQYALENDIHYVRVAETAVEAAEFAKPIPVDYRFELYPPIQENEGQRRRNMYLAGVVNGDIRAIHIPVQTMAEDGLYVDTEWSIRVIALPVAMLDESGKWHTHQILTSAEHYLVDSSGKIHWSNYFDDTDSDQVFASKYGLPSGFKENEAYNQSFPTFPLSEIKTRVSLGTSVVIYTYGVVNAVADSNPASPASREAQELTESIDFVKDQIGDFDFQSVGAPTVDQKIYAPSLAVNALDSVRLSEPYGIMDDDSLLELLKSGKAPKIFGGSSVLHTLSPSIK